MAAEYRVGTSGWHYPHWEGVFYPETLRRAEWLDFYCGSFSTVEVNNSFYRLPAETVFGRWRDGSPEGFVFAVKVSRFITHVKRLKDAAAPVANLLGRSRLLGDKLGPLLYQLPPQLKRDDGRLEEFLEILPRDVRHVFEFRHRSWLCDDVFALLARHGAGLCVYDTPDFTAPLVATSDFAYLRFHGGQAANGGRYLAADLTRWARRITDFNVATVFAYFNNDAGGFAVANALALKRLLAGSRL
jgi:uncharacterized protein YecE (DUF72 family)